MDRRRFVQLAAWAAVSALLPISRVSARAASGNERTLSFYNVHTGEYLKRVYWVIGEYDANALSDINYLMRDYRNSEIKKIEPELLDLLYTARLSLNTSEPYHLVSGYRSPSTNAMLASYSEGVAKHSLHMEGRAADVYLPGLRLNELHRVALALQGGGVGYYPRSQFVHLDVGRVRSWSG